MKLPPARVSGIIVQEAGSELLTYDLTTHKAYNLNETLTIIYQACGAGGAFDELRRKHQFTDDLIYLALDTLKENSLLATNADYKSSLATLSRREAIRRVGLSTMITLPLISSLLAPTPAMAQSATCQSGSGPNDGIGVRGDGAPCLCNNTNLDNATRACATTRGGMLGSVGTGCRAGCLCQSDEMSGSAIGICR